MTTTETSTKPKRETWRDWMPDGAPEPDELLTRDELLERLRGEGFVVSVDDLRNWQSTGTIPYGINRWRDGSVKTHYPRWMLDVVRTLRAMQSDGRKLAEIRSSLRDIFDRRRSDPVAAAMGATGVHPDPIETAMQQAGVHPDPVAAAMRAAGIGGAVFATDPVIEGAGDLAPRLAEIAREHERAFGGRIVRAELRLIDEHGLPLVFRFDLRQNE